MHFSRAGKSNKIPIDAAMPEIYKKYISLGGDKKYAPGVLGRVCTKFNSGIMDKMIYSAYEFKIPLGLGSLFIRAPRMVIKLDKDGKLMKKFMTINWDATKKLWAEDDDAQSKKILVYHFNDHFDRRIARFHYEKRNTRFKNKSFYKFKQCRTWSTELAKAINNEEIDITFVE